MRRAIKRFFGRSPASFQSVFIGCHVNTAAGGGSWTDWDKASEDTLALDQNGDGAEDTYVALFENTVAGGDETGLGGGLSGADLILSQAGNVLGAKGTHAYRALTAASSQRFDVPVNRQNTLNGKAEGLIMLKISDYSYGGNGMLLAWDGVGTVLDSAHPETLFGH